MSRAIGCQETLPFPNKTQESRAYRQSEKRIGFTGTWYDPEAARRVRAEGYIAMRRLEGWKADDIVFAGIEGVVLSHPISLVGQRHHLFSPSNHSQAAAPRSTATADVSRGKNTAVTAALRSDTRSWFETWFEKYGWKGVGVVDFNVIWAIGREVAYSRRKPATPDTKREA